MVRLQFVGLYKALLNWVLFFLTLTSSTPHYYIIVRLLPSTADDPLSAQFKQIHSAEDSPEWECKSGLTPITYPSGSEEQVQAKSMDLVVGSEVECLSLVVRVLVGKEVSLWEGDVSSCEKGFMTTTTELSRTEDGIAMFFKLIPDTFFSVYTSDPGVDCAKQVFKYINSPKLAFENESILRCVVISNEVSHISCNMTISTSVDDVMALATSTTEIVVPTFVWKINVQTIICSCSCRIKEAYSASDTVRAVSLNFTDPTHFLSDVLQPDEFQLPEQQHLTPTNVILLSVGVLSALLLITIISTVYLAASARLLKRKLKRARECGSRHQGTSRPPPSSSIPRPPGEYSHVHRVSNTCHHYNTVSLQLSDYLPPAADMQPIYQKLTSLTTKDTTGI